MDHFLPKKNEPVPGFVGLSTSDVELRGPVSWEGPGPDWAVGAYGACCADTVVLAKLCAVGDLGANSFLI